MTKSLSLFSIFSLLLLFFMACEDKTATPTPLGYDYYPLEIGSYQVFQLDSVIFDPDINGIRKDSVSLQVKEVVVDTFRDETNVLMYKMERYERPDENEDWKIKNVFAKGIDGDQAIYLDENLRFIKFIFPPKEFKLWNGNVHFDESLRIEIAGEPVEVFKSWQYEFTEVGTSFSQMPFEFDDIVTVSNANSENLIEYRSVTEKYARNIGLVYREMKIFDTQCSICCNSDFELCSTLLWEDKAEAGFILTQRLIEFK